MFALVVAWQSLGEEHQGRPLPDRLGLMMQHTRVAITITTLTDALAFSISLSNCADGIPPAPS